MSEEDWRRTYRGSKSRGAQSDLKRHRGVFAARRRSTPRLESRRRPERVTRKTQAPRRGQSVIRYGSELLNCGAVVNGFYCRVNPSILCCCGWSFRGVVCDDRDAGNEDGGGDYDVNGVAVCEKRHCGIESRENTKTANVS
jgi:hypothetical protein